MPRGGKKVRVPAHKQAQCIFCDSPGTRGVSKELSYGLFAEQNVISDDHHKVCDEHQYLNDGAQELPDAEFKEVHSTEIRPSVLLFLLERQKREIEELKSKKAIDIDSMSDDEFRRLTRIRKADFKELYEFLEVESYALFAFMLILTTGISQRVAGALLGIGAQTVNRYFSDVLTKATERFTNLSLGINCIDRVSARAHSTEAFQRDFPNVIGIWDGTYFYIEKSSDFEIQKKHIQDKRVVTWSRK